MKLSESDWRDSVKKYLAAGYEIILADDIAGISYIRGKINDEAKTFTLTNVEGELLRWVTNTVNRYKVKALTNTGKISFYHPIDDKIKVAEYVEALKLRSTECMSFRVGITTFVIFFINLDSQGGYLLVTHSKDMNSVHHYDIEITDDREVMKVIVSRGSGGNKEITDDQLNEILVGLEKFRIASKVPNKLTGFKLDTSMLSE
jgi:hypothetical protein